PLGLGQIVAGAVERATTFAAEYPRLVRRGAILFQVFPALGDMQISRADRCHSNESGAMGLLALLTMAHGDFIDLAAIHVADLAAQATSLVHRFLSLGSIHLRYLFGY